MPDSRVRRRTRIGAGRELMAAFCKRFVEKRAGGRRRQAHVPKFYKRAGHDKCFETSQDMKAVEGQCPVTKHGGGLQEVCHPCA